MIETGGPMKAPSTLLTDFSSARYPSLFSPKLDGYRAFVHKGVLLSKNLKPIRNEFAQALFGTPRLNGLDGELIVGASFGEGVLGRTSSGVTTRAGQPDVYFHVFDDFSAHAHPFRHRIGRAEDRVYEVNHLRLKMVPHEEVTSAAEVAAAEVAALARGYEGGMLKHAGVLYKFGRTTPTENTFWKIKRFRDGDARVLSIEEGAINNNPLERDALGNAKRSSHKAGKAPAGRVGTLLCVDCDTGEAVRVAPGAMTAKQRIDWWAKPPLIVGKLVKYKFFDYGVKDANRFCTFVALRDPADL